MLPFDLHNWYNTGGEILYTSFNVALKSLILWAPTEYFYLFHKCSKAFIIRDFNYLIPWKPFRRKTYSEASITSFFIAFFPSKRKFPPWRLYILKLFTSVSACGSNHLTKQATNSFWVIPSSFTPINHQKDAELSSSLPYVPMNKGCFIPPQSSNILRMCQRYVLPINKPRPLVS